MAKPTLELEALAMTDSELSKAQVDMRAAILEDAQQIKRLPPNASVDCLAAALRLKLACLETVHDERRIRRSFAGSKR